ncbi:uncharacterized protein LOC129226169 [Uloborus diversus]|uniref:uncharacterized protein LOC129226169 n=1 Tax=Uloborus diversus TaxID=327109 RepID=UPI002409BB82|nr:uncharacterized protein LOC129226169 [Uloborus diversus]
MLIGAGFGFKYMHELYNSHEWCSGNLSIITANGVICLLLVLLSTSHCVYQHTGGVPRKLVQESPSVVLLQTAALSVYVCYMTWSAIAGEYIYKAMDGFTVNKTRNGDHEEVPQDKIVAEYCGPTLSTYTGVSDNDVICYLGIFVAFATLMKET